MNIDAKKKENATRLDEVKKKRSQRAVDLEGAWVEQAGVIKLMRSRQQRRQQQPDQS